MKTAKIIFIGFMAIALGIGAVATAPNFISKSNAMVQPPATEPLAASKTVTISSNKFTPKVVTIKKGESVTWVNKEGTHTVKADDGSFQSGTLTAGKSFSHTFDKAGSYKYYCTFHGSAGGHDMAGTIVVK